jgi:metallo-beta-lactamase class B
MKRAGFLLLYGLLIGTRLWAQSVPLPPLTVTKIDDRIYVHTSHQVYGGSPFPSNGLVIKTDRGIVIIDTAWGPDQTRQLLHWVETNLHEPVRLCISTHFHDDRIGGTAVLRRAGVRVISTPLTAQKAATLGVEQPEGLLPNDTTITIGNVPIRCYFPGEGHSPDNIVVWLPDQRILFGGCLVKSVAAFGLGNLADANLKEWAHSIRNVQRQFSTSRIVVPGHQAWDDPNALVHTLQLLEKAPKK